MDALSRAVRLALLALLLLPAGCGADGGRKVPSGVTSIAPTIPDDVVVQLYMPSVGAVYRVAEDGRFLVTLPGHEEQQQSPRSKAEPGIQTLTTRGLGRLREALDESGFFSLPDQVAANDCVPEGAVLPNSGRAVRLQPIVFSARDGENVKTVEGEGDLAAPCTLGRLEPVYRALDLEALGDWMKE